jgi:tellurite resistance protein TehA-like permease
MEVSYLFEFIVTGLWTLVNIGAVVFIILLIRFFYKRAKKNEKPSITSNGDNLPR